MNRHLLCLVLIALWFLAACGPEGTTEAADPLYIQQVSDDKQDTLTLYRGDLPNVVRTHLVSEPKTLHPILQGGPNRTLVFQYVFESLETQDIYTGEVVPQLARMIDRAEDGNAYTYELLDGVHWPDGAPITVEDVIFSTKLNLCPHVNNQGIKPYLAFLSDIVPDPTDPRRFTVMMREYFMSNELFGIYFYLLDRRQFDPEGLLADHSLAEVIDPESELNQQEAVKAWGQSVSEDQIGRDLAYLQSGSGPYQVAEWTEGQQLRLTRTPDYWAAGKSARYYQQHPEEIIFTFVKDPQALEFQIKQQALDVSTSISSEPFDHLQASPLAQEHYHLTPIRDQSLTLIILNNRPRASGRSPVFEDPQVRRALAHAIDIDGMIADILHGYGSRSTTPVIPGNPHYQEQPPLGYELDSTRILLDQAGWQDSDQDGIRDQMIDGKQVPLRFELLFPPNGPAIVEMMDRVQRDLKAVGIDCQLRVKSMGEYLPDLAKGDFDAALFSFGKTNLPYDFHQLFHSSNYPNGYNFFGYANEEVDSMIERMRTTREASQRQALAAKIQAQLYHDQPGILLYYLAKKIAVHRRFNYDGPYPNSPFVLLNVLRMERAE
jgi:peptide/nickel transport system substrate-binding protein